MVLVLTACPTGLRGQLTRWLLEVAPGVFVGNPNPRVRDGLWERVAEGIGGGRALLVHSARNEQRLAFRSHGHDWKPTDFEGIELMMRPLPDDGRGPLFLGAAPRPPEHWSTAARRRRFGRMANRDPGLK
ncbi:type I-E CRISPR-associated endoribonuclease Cas2e [Georgenia sp. TF02-10]|uniref:type I-E CRISPR-associated endoribonuclease Cas2e n=1 Tax=Georgenia sp. TF02-10 TaxID=2917725 RepID=UPI001FA741A5|nr:type I-E CRISPR-associated endoribonuclease Cas2e [Georgenia sp. TF02-10]UNX56437.1 type I-E CRISPR-associated endoribonuclease Cas2e [Georgenia sp. TF02-10]